MQNTQSTQDAAHNGHANSTHHLTQQSMPQSQSLSQAQSPQAHLHQAHKPIDAMNTPTATDDTANNSDVTSMSQPTAASQQLSQLQEPAVAVQPQMQAVPAPAVQQQQPQHAYQQMQAPALPQTHVQPQPMAFQHQHLQQQYHAFMKTFQQYQMSLQTNPQVQNDPQFMRNYTMCVNGLRTMQAQMSQVQQAAAHGGGPPPSTNNPNASVPTTATDGKSVTSTNTASTVPSLPKMALQSLSKEQLPDISAYLNPQPQQQQMQMPTSATANNKAATLTGTPLNLPDLNPVASGVAHTTRGAPALGGPSPAEMTHSNSVTPTQTKRGRGRPKGSKNKKAVVKPQQPPQGSRSPRQRQQQAQQQQSPQSQQHMVHAIDREIAGKQQQMSGLRPQYSQARARFQQLSQWLSTTGESYKHSVFSAVYNQLTQQFADQYSPQQIHQLATVQSQPQLGEVTNVQQQAEQLHKDMNACHSQMAQLQPEIDALKSKRQSLVSAHDAFAAQQQQQQQHQQQQPQVQQLKSQPQNGYAQAAPPPDPQQQRGPNPWQAILNSGHEYVPQWVQCSACRKWRVMQVAVSHIVHWKEPSNWRCAHNQPPANHCNHAQEKPDSSQYDTLQLTALSIQRQIKMRRNQQRQQPQQQSALTHQMHAYRQRNAYRQANEETFAALMDLVEMKERKETEAKMDVLRVQKEAEKEAIRGKKKERELTRQAKKKKLKNKDYDDDEYLPDSDDTSDDDEDDAEESEDEEELLLRRDHMRARHGAPPHFNLNALVDAHWNPSEVHALVAFAGLNQNKFEAAKLAQDQALAQRHTDGVECQRKLAQIMQYMQNLQSNPRMAEVRRMSTNNNKAQSQSQSQSQSRSMDQDFDDDEDDEAYDGGGRRPSPGVGRKSTRLAAKKQTRVNYDEETVIDKYLAREAELVKKQRKAVEDVYEEKIERILAEKSVFIAPKTQTDYEDVQHAMDDGCKGSELIEKTKYLIKLDGISYLHVEWQTEEQMMLRFGKLRLQRKIASWNRQRVEYEQKCALLWGGEPFDPSFAEVDRVIDCIEVDGVEGGKKYFVKWMGLSYSCCTYETPDDIGSHVKIAEYARWNTLPSDTTKRHVDDAGFKKGMYGWYKLSASESVERHQPAQNAEDAAKKAEIGGKGVVPDDPQVYKGGNLLRDYQVVGLNWLIQKFYEGNNSILADEMGLGKTVQSVCFLEHLHRVNNVHGPFMIVAPLSTIYHWKREIEGWTDMNCVVYHDSDRGQLSRGVIRTHEFYFLKSKRKTPKFNILLTTYEILMCDLEWLANIKWFAVVVDEGHRLKSKTTQLARSFELMDAERRILLTGTPIQNSMDELFNLLHFLEPNQFRSLKEFNRSYHATEVSQLNGAGELNSAQQLSALQSRIQQYILRRLKENVEKSIPKKEETIIDIELTTIQKTYYRALFDRNREFLEAGVDKHNFPNLINLEVQLRKCCNHPWLIEGSVDRECGGDVTHLSHAEYMQKTVAASGKMVLLDKLLPKLKREGHRVLIFSQMRKVLDILEEYLEFKRYGYERFDGTTSSHDRQAAIDRFCKPDSDRLVFLLTTRAGGQGLNLVAADTVIIFDSDWNPQQDIQAQARCHRIGQKKTVSIYRLVTKNTYEAQMFERASRKLGLGQAILKSVEHGVKKSDVNDLKQLDNMLRHGAYAILNDDDESAKKWQECDIDELLQHAAHRVDRSATNEATAEAAAANNAGVGMHTFTRKTFESDKAKDTAALSVTDENFWNSLWKIRTQKAAQDKTSGGGDDDPDGEYLYLDNYLLDDKTRADRLLTSLTSLKDAANENAKQRSKKKRRQHDDSDDADSDVLDLSDDKIFASKKQRDAWFKRYKLHMQKMVALKESPSDEVPSLELQIQLSNLVFSACQHFGSSQRQQIATWNEKLMQRNRRKAKRSLNEDALSLLYVSSAANGVAEKFASGAAARSSKRKRKRDREDAMEAQAQRGSKRRRGNDADISSPRRDKLDKVWAFDYPLWAFNWTDSCSVCDTGGKLILCEGPCVGSFHLRCLGLKSEPTDDPWYCDACKALQKKRQRVYKLTGGKSSRFEPGTYTVKVFMDRNRDDPHDVHEVQTTPELTATCFHAKKSKSTKDKEAKQASKKTSKRKKKRTRDGNESTGDNDDDPKDEDYNIESDGKVVRKKAKSSKRPSKNLKTNSKNKNPKHDEEEVYVQCDTRMTRSQKKSLSKILICETGDDCADGGDHETIEVRGEDAKAEQATQEPVVAQQRAQHAQPQLQIDFNSLGNQLNLNFAGAASSVAIPNQQSIQQSLGALINNHGAGGNITHLQNMLQNMANLNNLNNLNQFGNNFRM